jgi:hypothetical protein
METLETTRPEELEALTQEQVEAEEHSPQAKAEDLAEAASL